MARLTELPSSPTPSPPTSPPPAQASPAPAAAAASTAQPADPALSEAQDLKTRANALFDAKRYEEAIALYADAVAALPPRPVPVPAAESKPDADENQPGRDAASSDATQREGGEKAVVGDTTTEPERTAEKSDGAEPAATATPAPRREDEGVTALRTTCYANQAAAYLKVEMWEQAREAASQALTDTPNHLKALHRRAQATEALARQLIAARQRGQAPSSGAGGDGDGDGDGDGEDDAGAGPPPGPPSSLSTSASSLLTSTEEDLTQLLAHPSLPPSLRPTIQQSHARVKRDLEAERERDKEEVLGKLKDMGDKVLGWFGMSLDQFKVDKGPGGGMNLRFGG